MRPDRAGNHSRRGFWRHAWGLARSDVAVAKKIGEILVERGLLTPEQVQQGLDTQKFYGGRVGSAWVDLGHVQERDLLDALCAQKKVKPAKASLLKSVSKATLDLLPVKVATRYKVVPLLRENRRLTVAMADPNDLLALDELQFISGSVIEPYLATERTILNALEKYYGVVNPRRDAVATDARAGVTAAKPIPAAPPQTSAGATKPDEGELFVDAAARADAEAARKFWAEQLKSGGAAGAQATAAAAGTSAAGVANLDALLAATPPPTAAASAAPGDVMDGNQLLVEEGDTVALKEAPDPLEEASRRLSRVEIRDDIADVLMWCTDGLFRRSALFIFQKTRTLGWTGQGEGLTADMVRKVVVPVEEVSIFTLVRDTPTHYLGPLPKNPGNERFVELLGGKWPPAVLVVPFGDQGPRARLPLRRGRCRRDRDHRAGPAVQAAAEVGTRPRDPPAPQQARHALSCGGGGRPSAALRLRLGFLNVRTYASVASLGPPCIWPSGAPRNHVASSLIAGRHRLQKQEGPARSRAFITVRRRCDYFAFRARRGAAFLRAAFLRVAFFLVAFFFVPFFFVDFFLAAMVFLFSPRFAVTGCRKPSFPTCMHHYRRFLANPVSREICAVDNFLCPLNQGPWSMPRAFRMR